MVFSRGTLSRFSRICRQPVLPLHSHLISQKIVSKFKNVILHNKFEGLFHCLGGEVSCNFFLLFFNPIFNLACPMFCVNDGVHSFGVSGK